jgi:methyltransferase-like protein
MTDTLDSYDQIPYDAVPITDTHPDRLCTLGRLFGIPTADPQRCRVLEFGCADGANLIPLAYYLPDSRFTGVDLSRVQVESGRALIERLRLNNVELTHGDVLTLPDSLGSFDYIIAHGLYSWVPPPVQTRILELCGKLLAPHGVAYVSYNVLPGWRGRAMVRDMLLHRCRDLTAPRERLHAAQDMLATLHHGWTDLDAPAIAWLRHEVDHLRDASASYLFHEYLEEHNEPVLFTEFMRRAQQQGLRYVCDSDLYTMFPSSLGEKAEKLLNRFDDLIEQEQYMDFLRARPFRRSILCRADCALERDLDLGVLRRYHVAAHLAPRETPEFGGVRAQSYLSASGKSYDVAHPLTKLALQRLAAAYPSTLPMERIVEQAREDLENIGMNAPAQQSDALLRELFDLFSMRAIVIAPREERCFNQVSARPRAHRLAHAQAPGGHVTSIRHIGVDLDPLAAHLLTLLDGTRTRDELINALLDEVDRDLGARDALRSHDGDTAQLHQRISSNVDRLLTLFARHGLLDA